MSCCGQFNIIRILNAIDWQSTWGQLNHCRQVAHMKFARFSSGPCVKGNVSTRLYYTLTTCPSEFQTPAGRPRGKRVGIAQIRFEPEAE